MKKTLLLVLSITLLSSMGYADNQNSDTSALGSLNTPEAKEQYRLFLQKLKELNSQYKQFTGEMAQVIKEEGVPSWDAGFQATSSAEATIKETPEQIFVTMDLPGIDKKTLKITAQEANRLSIKAERKIEGESHLIEKTIQLPGAVDARSAQAKYTDGVLTLKMTKLTHQEVSIPVK